MIATQLDITNTTKSIDTTAQTESRSLSELAVLIDQAFHHYDNAHRALEVCCNEYLDAAKALGEYLILAKDQMQHGEWLPWVKANCKFSDSKARQCMTIARNWEFIEQERQQLKSGSDPDLGMRKALALIRGKTNSDEIEEPVVEQIQGELVEEDTPQLPTVKRSPVKRSPVKPLVNDPPQTNNAPSPFQIGSIVRVVQEGHEFCGKGVFVDDRIDGGEILLFRALQDGRPGHIFPNDKTPALEPAPENIGELVQETINEMGLSDNSQLYLFKQFLADEKLVKRLSPKLRAKFLNMQAWMRKG